MKGKIKIYGEVIHEQINEPSDWGCVNLIDVNNQIDSQPDATEFVVEINSVGGTVSEGFAIYQRLRELSASGKPITTQIKGQCASIATIIFLAGDTRKVNEFSELFIHEVQGWTGGSTSDIKDYAEQCDLLNNKLAEIYERHLNIGKDGILQLMKNETYVSCDKALERGFATEKEEILSEKEKLSIINKKRESVIKNKKKTGVKKGDKIPLADKGKNYNYMKSKEGLTSQCDFNECDVTVKFSTKKWDTHAYNCEVKLCRADLESDFLEYFGTKCNAETDVQDAFIKFLVDWVNDALIASHWVKVWFTSGSYPTTSGLYGADGLFTQMMGVAQVGSTQRIEIPENKNNDYATQLALDPQRGFEVFSEMYDRALKNVGLRGAKNIQILTTEDLAINYLQYLRNNNQVNCCYKEDVTAKVYDLDKLNIFGMPIKIVREWDEIIQGVDINGTPYFSELNNGTKFTAPHRAVLTYKENIPVGTCNSKKLDNVEVLYNPYDRNMSIRSEYEIGANLLLDKDLILAV